MGIGAQIGDLAYRGNFLDLDPTYKDAYGLPLLRLTYDWGPNERRASAYLREVCERLARALNPRAVTSNDDSQGQYSIVPYQSTHNTGGAAMGPEPATSAVNRYLQSWDVANVFVVGASAFPQNAGYNPTGTVGALAYWAAHAITTRYAKRPGLLA
jgi:gluconate 2-dehydrogenase alpha chain